MDAVTSNETYEFACRRCGQHWRQEYEIRRRVDCDGDEHVACGIAGIPVAPPWSAPPCPHCGGYRTMLLPHTATLLRNIRTATTD